MVDVPMFDLAIKLLAGLVFFFEVQHIKRFEQGVYLGSDLV